MTSPLSQELQQLLGPVTYQDADKEALTPLPMPESTIKEGRAPVPKNTEYTDSSCWGQPLTRRAGAYEPSKIAHGWKITQDKIGSGPN